jgi:hypothetical protein
MSTFSSTRSICNNNYVPTNSNTYQTLEWGNQIKNQPGIDFGYIYVSDQDKLIRQQNLINEIPEKTFPIERTCHYNNQTRNIMKFDSAEKCNFPFINLTYNQLQQGKINNDVKVYRMEKDHEYKRLLNLQFGK